MLIFSGKGVIVGILKTGQKNLFLSVNACFCHILRSNDSHNYGTILYRTHVGYSTKYHLCVYLTSMSMSQSKDVAMGRPSLKPC